MIKIHCPRPFSAALLAASFLVQQDIQAAASLPVNGSFVAGSGSMSTSGNILTINQNSLKGIIDWNTFSIGQGAAVNFKNGNGTTLNRVTGNAPTGIFGQLLASGSVYLLNPEGILIGHGAAIHTGGDFLATTLSMPDSLFLANKFQLRGDSAATVVNLGNIASSGGNIYLIGRTVENGGSLSAANGSIGLAAGSRVLIADSGSGQKVSVEAPGGDVTNSGFIRAAEVELKSNGGNIYALAGNNGGLINATGTATQGGQVWLMATNGTTNISGSIAAANANGSGGAIETSGAHVTTGAAQITTGKGGRWLLDPDDLLIDSTLAGTIESSLNGGTNVTEQTGNGNTGSGDITVAGNIAWTTGANLTLSAFRNIGVNNGVTISNTGSGNLTLRADNTSTGTGTISFAGTGKVDFSGSTGNVALLYNPTSYAAPTNYSSNVLTNGSWVAPSDGSVSSQMTAYMLVNSAANLQNLDVNDTGTYALGTDVNLSSISNFMPLAATFPFFSGILDGMGHTISNLTMSNSSGNSVPGLFNDIESAGKVRNLNLTNVNITQTGVGNDVGALVGNLYGTVSNVSAGGVIHLGSGLGYAGGLVGDNIGKIQNSSSSMIIDASLTTQGTIGGLEGINDGVGGTINSYATGSINAPNLTSGSYVGGLSGDNWAPITNSYATGAVNGGAATYIGGLVGNNESGYSISGSYATGAVTGHGNGAELGGLAGYSSGPISGSYATGSVTTSSAGYSVGGLVGYNASTISNSHATGAVTDVGSDYIGGLTGWTDGTISGSYASGSVSSSAAYGTVGGLSGGATAAISGSYATGPVTGTGDGADVGGLVGYTTSGGTITTSYANGPVTDSAGYNAIIGGLVGWSAAAITQSYATGAVLAGSTAYGGGLVGYGTAPISTSYAIGSVTGGDDSTVGGLVGIAGATITDTYAQGHVTEGTSGQAGGLVGQGGSNIATSYSSGLVSAGSGAQIGGLIGHRSGGTVTSSYFDNVVNPSLGAAGVGSQTGVTGESTAILRSGTLPSGFNSSIWTAPAGVYPYFGWQGGLVTVSGTAYNGSSTIASAGVGVLSNGALLANLTTNGSGFYTLSEPANMVNTNAGVLTYLESNGTANTFSTGPTFTGMDLHTGSLSLLGGSATTMSGISNALATTLGGNSGPNFLFSVPNGGLTLNSNAALSLSSTAPSFAIDQPISGSGNILITVPGNLSIGSGDGLATGSGYNITLVDGGTFSNSDGANALSVSGAGRWLVDSQNPANDSVGGLTPVFKQYNASYGVTAPAHSGNGLLYTLAPMLAVTLTGSLNKVYDGTTSATVPAGDLNATGAIQGDVVSVSAGSAAYGSANAGSGLGITASNVMVTASYGSIPVYGYQWNSSASGNIGTITPATLTYVATPATQVSGSSNSLFTGGVTGFVNGETAATATSGTASFGSSVSAATAAGTYAITGSGLAANHGNYVFTQGSGNATALTITLAPAPTPTPTPTLTPAAATTIAIDINSISAPNGQVPTFSATYNGPAVNGLDVASLLSGLTYTITPALNGPGTYKVSATGTAPAGYTFSILPGTFTVVDSSPTAIPTEAALFKPEVPVLITPFESASEGTSLLAPANSLGMFQIVTVPVPSGATSGFGVSVAGFDGAQTPLSQSSYFGTASDKPSTFVAGAKP